MTPVPSVLRVLLVQLVTLEPTARTVSLVLWELVAIAVLRVFAVSLGPLVLRASRARKVRKAALVLVGSKVSRDLRVTLATAGLRVLAVVVRLVPRVLKESRDLRANVVSLVLVLVAPLVQWAPRVSAVRWASKVRRAILAPQVLKVSVVATVSRATRELLAPWAAQASVALRVTAVCRDPRVTLAFRGPRETREMSAFADPPVPLASPAHLVLREVPVSEVLSDLWAGVASRVRRVPPARWDPVVLRATVATVA